MRLQPFIPKSRADAILHFFGNQFENNCYEQIFEIIQFRTRADADEFNDTVNYGLVESCHLEWRQINTN